MIWNDAKKYPPKVSKRYTCVKVSEHSTAWVMDLYYDTERKGWNVGIGTDPDSREYEQFPDYWGTIPTKEELEGGES